MKFFPASLKKDPAYFFFTLFVFLSFISTLAGQIALVLSLVCTFACKESRRRFRMTWPTWGWLAYLALAVVVSGIMLAVNTDELLNPGRGFSKIFEHLLWYIAIPVVSAQMTSRERFEKTLHTVAAGGLVLALIVLVRNPLLAWFRYSYPNPGEVAVLQSGGLDVTDDWTAIQKILIRNPVATGGFAGTDAAGVPAGDAAKFINRIICKAGLEKKATSWVFSVKPRRKVVDKNGRPYVLRHGVRKWNWYGWNADETYAGVYYLTKRELYFHVHDTLGAGSGNRPSTFVATLEALGEHGDAQRLLAAFLASLLLACASWKRLSAAKRFFAVLIPALSVAAIAVSFKEGALVVSVIMAILVALSFFWRNWWKLALCIIFLLTVAVGGVAVPCVSSGIKSAENSLLMHEYRKGGRLMMWMDIVPAVHAEHPYGTGFKGITSGKMRSVNYAVEPREHVHNVLLQVFLDFGYIGVAVWAFWMLASLYFGLRLMGNAESQLAISNEQLAIFSSSASEPSGGNTDSQTCKLSNLQTGNNCKLHIAHCTLIYAFPFAALCALLAVGVIEYNLPDSESVLMYSIAMGMACPFFASVKKPGNGGIAFLEKVFLCPKKGGGESLRGVELFNLNLVKDLITAGYTVFFPVDKTWLPTVKTFAGESENLVLCPIASMRHPLLNCLAASFAIRKFALRNGRFKVLFVANDVNGIIPSVFFLKKTDVFDKAVVFAHKLPSRGFMNVVSDIPGHIIGVCESIAAPFRTRIKSAERGVRSAEFAQNTSASKEVPPSRSQYSALHGPAIHADYGIAGGDAFYPAEKSDVDGNGTVKFCLVGGLDSVWKGADTAVEAFKLLPEEVRNRSELHLMAFKEDKDFGDKRIICHKWIKPEEVSGFLRSMDVMLAPSRLRESDGRLMETFSQVVVQGMLTGLPVIYTSLPVFVEKFDNGGGIQADKPSEFAEAMTKLAGNAALRAELGAAGRKTALERYVWNTSRFIERYIEN